MGLVSDDAGQVFRDGENGIMTDEQIRVELARRVHGWKIPPDKGREEWFADAANYPCLWVEDELVMLDIGDIFGDPWNPFSSWADAMALAEAWMDSEAGDWYDLERLPVHGYCMYLFPPETAKDGEPGFYTGIDPSGPRAVTLAIARATGIEVEK